MQQLEYRITTEFIELNQLLKICGLASSGGAGGALVSQGNVEVNGQRELRKRCKIRPGQVVRLGGLQITVLAADAAEIAAKAEARAAKALERAGKQRAAAVPAPWMPRVAAKAGPKPGAKPGPKARRKPSESARSAVREPAGVDATVVPAAKSTTKQKTLAGQAWAARRRGKR